MTLRLVVTGSRKFTNKRIVRKWIFDAIAEWRATMESPYSLRNDWTTLDHVTLIHGCARGFDRLAEEVAHDCHMHVIGIPAEWDHIGSTAGRSRNWRMILEGKPTFGLVGPGGYGTAHMHQALVLAGIPLLYKGDSPIT